MAGGPEPPSGKLRSGIVSWWRLSPATPAPGVPFELILRLEAGKADDASAAVATSDGARLADSQARREWTLPADEPALLTLKLVAPAGDSYLHLTTRQHGRSSVRSIRLALPAGAAASGSAKPHEVDARGEPIVRMESGR